MDSVTRSRQAQQPGSAGKILRTRRPARTRTPYDRPPAFTPNPPPPPRPPQNPNWLSRLIYSPTRSIFSSAGKVLSSVFGSDSASSSSSEIGSDDEEGDDDDDYVSSQEDDGLNKGNEASETVFQEGGTLHAIEQLLMQETFSREECDKLIKIIKSRVIGSTTAEDAEKTRPNIDATDLSSTVVSEAKKWVMEKRLGSGSKSELDHGTFNSVLSPQGAAEDGGSPVDVAKSYMRALPPWASPSQHGELKSTSPLGLKLFNEETPRSIGRTSVSTSKLKRDTPATGSWNIQDEIQRVRTKATEEMLRSLPSSRIDWSAYSLENRSTLNSLPDEKQEVDLGDKLKNPDELQKEALTAHTTNGFPSSAPSLPTQLGREEICVLSGQINKVSSNHEKIVTNLLVEETYELGKEATIDLSKNDETDIEGTRSPDNMPLDEANVEVENVNKNDADGTKGNDGAVSGSQNSSSMPFDLSQVDLSPELTQRQPNLGNTGVAKEDSDVENPKKATRVTRSRRGRSRGK